MGIWTLFGMIFWIVLIVGVVLMVIWFIQRAAGGVTGKTGESALEDNKKRVLLS